MTDDAGMERLPVNVNVDAPFEEIVQAFQRLWKIAAPSKIGNVIYAIEDMRPDLKLVLVEDFQHDGPGVICTASLSGSQIKRDPDGAAERQARRLVELLEVMRWREAGSAPPPQPDPERIEAARRIADKARRTDPDTWPGWSTSERIMAALAADRPDCLPPTWPDAEEAWEKRLDDTQRAVVREVNPSMAHQCEASEEKPTAGP